MRIGISAAGAGRLSDVRELLEKGANIEARDSDGYTSLHRAAEGGHLEIIRFLIDKGANIGAKNKDGKNPLDVANDLGKTEVVNFLGPKQSEYDRLLFAAVESGNVSEVTNLLNIGANIEARGAKNETPLCAASRINKLDVLELLLSRNANVNVQDDDRRTPLHHAAYLGKGVELILDKGANIEAKDINDWTPLHYAAWGGQSDTVKTLVNKWANIGAKNKDGGKPLDVANTSRQSEVVNFLGPKQSEYDRLLFAAVESGNVSEVTNLLNIGASIEVKGVENAEFRLARYVKRIMEMSNYHNVHSEKKSELERIKGELPESVKNAVFSSEVCIKSVYYSNEYLYPASDYLSHDRDRRRVFTWRPGGKDSSCQWKFEPEGNNIYIKSTYFNEYLYPAGNGLSHDRDRRRVFTWRPGGKDSSCQWKFEPEGNNIYIKSTYFNEYLYPASDYLSHDRDRRRVFTWRPGAKIVHVNGKLRIVDLLARSVMYNIVLQKKLSVIYLMIMHQTIHRKVTK